MCILVRTNSDPNIIPAIQNFQGFAFFLEPKTVPFYCDCNNTWEWMHKDPTTTPTEVHTAAGSMSAVAGGYKYFYTEINRRAGGGLHDCHETNPSPVSTITGNFTNKKVVLTLPATGVNTFTTHLKVYGTDDGGSIYYYLGNVAIGTTTFDDNNITRDATLAFGKLTTASDGVVSQTYLNYCVKNHRYLVATKSRILVCGAEIITDGTVAVTNGSATVNGTGTAWSRAIDGDTFQVDGDTRVYTITWVSSTEITLDDTYEGSTDATATYKIYGADDIVRWTAKHPSTAKPMFWAFPASFYRRIVSKDYSPIMGCNKVGNQPVVFKRYSHYLLTENGDDYIIQEARTNVGTCSHWSAIETGELGTLIFMNYEGLIYESTGLEARDLDIDLSKTIDGINKSRLKYVQAIWIDHLKWYVLIYSKKGSSVHDRILIYDYQLKQWVIWAIRGNAIGYVESTESGQTVYKPWLGTVGGFVYKMLTGNNLGAGTSGTIKGTATSFGAATLTDTSASFYTTGDGHKDVYVSLFDTDGTFKEEQKISSNTGDTLTVDTNWTSSPQVGWTYEIGSIRWFWKSKVHDLEQDESKSIDNVLINFKKVSSTRNVDVKFYFSNDPDMIGDTANQTITFDLSQDYYEPLGLYDNRFRYMQYEISGHGNADPVVVNNIVLEFQSYLR